MINGQLEMLHNCLLNFCAGTEYKNYLNDYLNEQRIYNKEIQREAERICGIPKATKKAKALARDKLQRPIKEDTNERKRAHEEQRIEKNRRLDDEREQKRLKCENDQEYLEEQKRFHASRM
jgi:hypothetical protein